MVTAPPKATTTHLPTPRRPFELLQVYNCPFFESPTCPHKDGRFDSFRGLTSHIARFHAGEVIVSYVKDQSEDGTLKIPCQLNCGEMFISHYHATRPGNFKKELSICRFLFHLGLVWFPVMSQIALQAPRLVVPFRQFLYHMACWATKAV